ncbi:phage tail protein [Xenorhabdus sp. XENO-1]|uniref:phage tail protein n=1 Tax=Xenorhabdus bovienii TaxID=40576 RepID=UPI0020CA2F5D|nr:phage tail protein [Xenorhabdus bovienii]MCP9270292.1 phage tail protein [Xenorhabdus bovienii subsp. africana]
MKIVGLVGTVDLAKNAVPKGSFGFGGNGGTVFYKNNNEFLTWVRRNNVSPEFFRNSAPSDYTYRYGAGILLKAADTYASLSVDYSTARVKVVAGDNSGNANSPIRELAFTDESYTKSESDNRFIRSNVNTKTSGYILSKTANYLEDTNSRHLGRSGFLRPNGMDNLGDLAIHVAHPSVEGPQHARGISFSYGSDSNGFNISTYAFDGHGKFQGQRRILTEDDKDSLGSVPVGVPLPWPQDKPPSGYLICNGQHFDKSKYPKLVTAYPSGTVPDLRGEFIRGWDNGRGIDSGRIPLSYQSPTLIRTAVLDYLGDDSNGVRAEAIGIPFDSADFTTQAQPNTAKAPNNQPIPGGNTDSGIPGTVSTAALRVSEWASWWFSTRPRNIAFLYIVRAA